MTTYSRNLSGGETLVALGAMIVLSWVWVGLVIYGAVWVFQALGGSVPVH